MFLHSDSSMVSSTLLYLPLFELDISMLFCRVPVCSILPCSFLFLLLSPLVIQNTPCHSNLTLCCVLFIHQTEAPSQFKCPSPWDACVARISSQPSSQTILWSSCKRSYWKRKSAGRKFREPPSSFLMRLFSCKCIPWALDASCSYSHSGILLPLPLSLVFCQIAQQLLLNILPPSIATRLKNNERPIADAFDAVTCVFIDMVGFTTMSSGLTPTDLVEVGAPLLLVLHTR
mgnify:CR=1 FL=1